MIQVEICCGGYEDAAAAERGGAGRVELNSALSLGGLTPDIGDLLLCKEKLSVSVVAMVRPRAGGFCYTAGEFLSMLKSAERMLSCGADGLAFGILTRERHIDLPRTRQLTEFIHSYGKDAVFHRAFDCLEDLPRGMEELIEMGVDRVLTSGGALTAPQGAGMLAGLQRKYGSRIEILAGCGVRSSNVRKLVAETGISQVHSSCKGVKTDDTAHGKTVSFAITENGQWNMYPCVDEAEVKAFCAKVRA